ncbi:MAG: response regulator transcription factor [Nitrospirae bacterium]|nr:response regulator transcription factor [Nitrospirota bacterium]
MNIRILIADDQRLFRQSLKYLIEQEKEIKVVSEAANGQDACTLALEFNPDIILMDVDMPKLDGIDATRLILEQKPKIKILMLSVHDDDERIISAIRNGAIGYILKDADHREFIRIIRSTYLKEEIISPFLANRTPKIIARIGRANDDNKYNTSNNASRISELTDREVQIVKLLADGRSNKEIADSMFVALETVKSHLQTIYKKMDVKGRTEAAVYYLREKAIKTNTNE